MLIDSASSWVIKCSLIIYLFKFKSIHNSKLLPANSHVSIKFTKIADALLRITTYVFNYVNSGV